MGVLLVVADRPGAGKTCLIGALLTQLLEQGGKAGYFKPFSHRPGEDPDPEFFGRDVLGGPDAASPAPAGYPGRQSSTGHWAQEVRGRLASLLAVHDFLLVEGPELFDEDGRVSDLPARLAAALDCKAALVWRYSQATTADALSAAGASLGDRLAGIVINQVPKHRLHHVDQELLPGLGSRNLPVLGAIPEDRVMLSATVQQVADFLGGRWAQEPAHVHEPVVRFLIGANIMDSGPSYFGRLRNQAVITRADRPDIQMASLVGDTRCLVLTGGGEPAEYIRVEARQHEVPLLLVEDGTLAIAERLGGLLAQSGTPTPRKVRRFGDLAQQYLTVEPLLAELS